MGYRNSRRVDVWAGTIPWRPLRLLVKMAETVRDTPDDDVPLLVDVRADEIMISTYGSPPLDATAAERSAFLRKSSRCHERDIAILKKFGALEEQTRAGGRANNATYLINIPSPAPTRPAGGPRLWGDLR